MSSIHYSIIKQCQDLDRLTIDTRHSLNLDIRRSWYNTPMVSGAGHLHSHVERGSKTDKGGLGACQAPPWSRFYDILGNKLEQSKNNMKNTWRYIN